MNTTQKTLIALGIFVVLLVIVVLTRRDPYEPTEKDTLPQLPQVDVATIDKVELVNKDEALTFEKRGDQWWITSPREVKANENFKALVVDKIGELALDRVVSENADTHAKFSLDDSGTRMTVYTGGTEALSLVVGKNMQDYRGTFVRLPDSNTVYATAKVVGSVLTKDLAYWRDKTIAKIDANTLRKINVKTADGEYTLVKNPAEPLDEPVDPNNPGPAKTPPTWAFADDDAATIDQNRVKTTVSTLNSMTWAEIVEQPGNLESYGLSEPAFTITAIQDDGSEATLLVGKLDEDQKMGYVMVKGGQAVYQVRKYQHDRLTKTRGFYLGE